MKFFFHIERKFDYIEDEVGTELPNVPSAHTVALRSVRELVVEAIKSDRQLNLKSIVITDTSGTFIGKAYATDVVPCDLKHQICWAALE